MQVRLVKGMNSLSLDVSEGLTLGELLNRADCAAVFNVGDRDAVLDDDGLEVDRADYISSGTYQIVTRANTKA